MKITLEVPDGCKVISTVIVYTQGKEWLCSNTLTGTPGIKDGAVIKIPDEEGELRGDNGRRGLDI
ncbi:MAG: hypothetical protein K5663_08420 [Clostridiales bacterium]|nr:hypothetical protein [Clostridiales bacterium]